MSDVPQPGPPWPFGGGFDLSQMIQMLSSEGPVNWEVARQVATTVALADAETGAPGTEPSWTQADASRLIEMTRIAQSHVAEATGLAAVHGLEPHAIGVQDLARSTLKGLRPVLESLATTLAGPHADEPSEALPPDPLAALGSEAGLERLLAAMSPMLLGVQAGTMAGYVGQRGLSTYELTLPLDAEPDLAFVVGNVLTFASDWEIAFDDTCLALSLRESVRAAQRTVGWLGTALVERARAFVVGYDTGGPDVAQRFGELELGDPEQLQELLGNPGALLGMIRSPAQQTTGRDLRRLVAVLEGYTDTVAASIGEPLLPSFGQVDEALKRRRIERGRAGALLDEMLGLDLSRDDYELGRSFCAGVVEREGLEGINRLWESESHIPTESELEAPGLWLARLELEGDD